MNNDTYLHRCGSPTQRRSLSHSLSGSSITRRPTSPPHVLPTHAPGAPAHAAHGTHAQAPPHARSGRAPAARAYPAQTHRVRTPHPQRVSVREPRLTNLRARPDRPPPAARGPPGPPLIRCLQVTSTLIRDDIDSPGGCAQVDGQVRRPDLRGHRKDPRPPVAAGTGHVRPTGQRAPPPIQGTPSVRSEPAAADATRSGASRGRARRRRLSARTLGRLRLLAQGPHHGVLPARCPGEQTRPGCPRRVARAPVDALAYRPDRRITLPLGRADYTL